MSSIRRWSFSGLSIFEQCPLRAKFRYIDRVPEPEFSRNSAAARGSMVHDSAEQVVKGAAQPTPELQAFLEEFEQLRGLYDSGTVRPEAAFAFNRQWEPCEYRSDDQWVEMVLDALVVLDPRTLLVVDYKTGKKEGNEIKHADQGALYMVGAFLAYPEVERVYVEFWYLDKNDLSRAAYDRKSMKQHHAVFDKRGTAMTSATFFPAEPSRRNCKWCPYRASRTGGTGHCEVSVD